MKTRTFNTYQLVILAVAFLAVAVLVHFLSGEWFGGLIAAPFFVGMAADAELIIRDGANEGALIGDETTGALEFGPTGIDGLLFRVHVPTDGGAADLLDIIFKTSATSGGTYLEEDRIPWQMLSQADGTKTLAGIYFKRIHLKRAFCKVTFDTTDGGANGVNFGNVDLRAVTGGEYNDADRDL